MQNQNIPNYRKEALAEAYDFLNSFRDGVEVFKYEATVEWKSGTKQSIIVYNDDFRGEAADDIIIRTFFEFSAKLITNDLVSNIHVDFMNYFLNSGKAIVETRKVYKHETNTLEFEVIWHGG